MMLEDNSFPTPPTLRELRARLAPLRDANAEHKKRLSRMDRFAVWITTHVGTMGFFLLIFGWTVLWLLWNTLAPAPLRFDPFPAFVMWLFISNMLQIFLMPLIIVGQNLQGRHAEVRAEADFEVNLKAERELETILAHLERQHRLMLQILQNVAKKSSPGASRKEQ